MLAIVVKIFITPTANMENARVESTVSVTLWVESVASLASILNFSQIKNGSIFLLLAPWRALGLKISHRDYFLMGSPHSN